MSLLLQCWLSDSNLAKLKAIPKALEISKNLLIASPCESIFIESDSKIALLWVVDLNSAPWRTPSIINSIVNCMHILPHIEFIHTPREANLVVESLAK